MPSPEIQAYLVARLELKEVSANPAADIVRLMRAVPTYQESPIACVPEQMRKDVDSLMTLVGPNHDGLVHEVVWYPMLAEELSIPMEEVRDAWASGKRPTGYDGDSRE